MAMKIIGVIMILVGIYGIFDARQGAEKGSLLSCRGDGDSCWEYKKSDPNFDKEVRNMVCGGVVSIIFGVIFLFIPEYKDEDDDN